MLEGIVAQAVLFSKSSKKQGQTTRAIAEHCAPQVVDAQAS
jgi:hypothetical protein